MSSIYNIRCDTDLSLSKAAIRRIPYTCDSCIKQLELSWDKNEKYCNQKTYDENKGCLYWNIFESLNDWNIIILAATRKNNTEKDDELFGTILRGVENRMSKKIETTIYDVVRMDDESTDE